MSRNSNGYKFPSVICKFDSFRECFVEDKDCDHCSRNPNRFDNRTITKGQMIFLVGKGYNENEISMWDFKRACKEIDNIKHKTN